MLTISQYFKNLIPPLSSDEFSQLEENILAHGCRDTIKHWRGTIVDGHNRYAICQKHNLPFKEEKLPFGTKKDAAIWILGNQLGRRNLSKPTLIKLGLEKARLLGQNIRKYAAMYSGASEGTVRQYMKIVEHGEPALLQQLENGGLKIGKAYKDLRQCRVSKSKLDVTTTTIEVLYNSSAKANVTTPKYAKAAAYNFDATGQNYEYIIDKATMLYPGDEMDYMYGRVLAHVRVVRGMLM